ncbi:MAG TPA: MFS transporter [Candidatus Baltobacteraceae bacterium]|jgi:MFS family permease
MTQDGDSGPFGGMKSKRYLVYLMAVALFGWALASFDFNIYVLTISNIAKTLKLPATEVGLVGFCIYAGEFVGSLYFGMMMDKRGRRLAWLVALAGATIFTGLTYFVQNFWELSTIRALADLFAYSELAISVTIVNEELPAKNRAFLYSIVQAGWPLGVVGAALAYIGGIHWGWRVLFLFSVPPLIVVAVARIWIKEPRRWLHLNDVRHALNDGDKPKAEKLKKEYDIDTAQVHRPSISQLFTSSPENRRQFIVLSLVWFFYGCSYTATNAYIVYWLVTFHKYSIISVAEMLLATAAIGFFVYILAGWMGQRIPRVYMLIVAGGLVAPLSIVFLYVHDQFWVYFVYFFIYQMTNGFWSGVAYAYNAESFPTRYRGTATGALDAVQIIGFLVGAGIWTALIGHSPQLTWYIVAAGLSLGMYFTIMLRKIPAGQELEAIAK